MRLQRERERSWKEKDEGGHEITEREKGLEKIKEPRRGKEGESCFSFLVLLLEREERERE